MEFFHAAGFLRQAHHIPILLGEFGTKISPSKRSVLDVLHFLPKNFDFFYDIKRSPKVVEEGRRFPAPVEAGDKVADAFSFELNEMDEEGLVSKKQIAVCWGDIMSTDLLYISWLNVEAQEYRGLQLGYLMLYISGLFALSRGCHRIALYDATEMIEGEEMRMVRGPQELRRNIYKNLCLEHWKPKKEELKRLHARRSNRINRDGAMIGNLHDFIQRLEGEGACDPNSLISFKPEDVSEKVSARQTELMEMDTSSEPEPELPPPTMNAGHPSKRFKTERSRGHAGVVRKKKTKRTRQRQQRQRQQRQRTNRTFKTDQFKKKKKKKGSTRRKSAGKSIPKKVARRKKNNKGRR